VSDTPCKNPNCEYGGKLVMMASFDGYCCVDCRKKAGVDHVDYSNSEMMLVTKDEASQIKADRGKM
jgi:hypothetical protein